MNRIKTSFSIRDLENLSGIKAHTIRIWEKRYGLLTPQRSDTNIRTYDISQLQKLLNVTLLYKNGLKISKIAQIKEAEIPIKVREIVAKSSVDSHAINSFKLAMMNFDQALFQKTYANLLSEKSFQEIFWDVFIPLLHELGLLWQTETISPSHEHFISNLIKQKIYTSTEKLQGEDPIRDDKVFVLFLPEDEIHEIGLLFLNYEMLIRGYQTIYLGPSMPIEYMVDLHRNYSKLHFLSYFTVVPTKEKLENYIAEFKNTLNINGDAKLWILGRQTQYLLGREIPGGVSIFESIKEVTDAL